MLKLVVVTGGVVVAAVVVETMSKYEYFRTAAAQVGAGGSVVVAARVELDCATPWPRKLCSRFLLSVVFCLCRLTMRARRLYVFQSTFVCRGAFVVKIGRFVVPTVIDKAVRCARWAIERSF